MKDLNKYLKKRSKNIEKLLSTPRLKCTPEIFHYLRVEIKKLRTLFSLLKSSVKYDQKKKEKPFRKVFKQAGIVREIQVEQEMLQRYFTVDFLNDYRKKLKERKSKELRKYIETVNSQIQKIQKRFLSTKAWITLIDKTMIEEFIDKKNKKMMKLFISDDVTPPQLHLLRKRIKQYGYALKFTGAKNHKNAEEGLGKLTSYLGKWHDGQMLIYHLEREKHNPGIQTAEIEQIEKIWNEQITVNNITLNQIKAIITGIKESQLKIKESQLKL